MFEYKKLTEFEKEIIVLLGDHITVEPIHDVYKMKIYKDIYKIYYYDKMNYYEYEENLKLLCIKGLVSFVPANINIIDNVSKNSEERLIKAYEGVESIWKDQEGLVRLTFGNERTITGVDVYNHLVQEKIEKKYNQIEEMLKEIDTLTNKTKKFENKLDNINGQYINTMAIFIAVFTIFAGNISVFKDIDHRGFENVASLILLTNGTILLCISFLFMTLKFLILNQSFKWGLLLFYLIPITMLVTALLL
ncbi:hypothetical protein E2R55_16335 [Vibrio vulnificus]|nr:hypothetical protein E2R55_16335 [Vibrio vulnificus]